MVIKNGIIFIWSGTHATIPTGWSRVTDMDSKYPKGSAASTNPNETGGAATHTHTSDAHSHATAQAHTHTTTINAGSGGGAATGSYASANSVIVGHTHAAVTSGAVGSFSTSSVTSTYGACSTDPLFSTVIYITPTTCVSTLAAGVIGLADAAAPTGFYACDGENSTPDLVDKFLKGAATGADAGTTGGSNQNTHALSHTHTTSHVHSSTASGAADAGWADKSSTGSAIASYSHSHTTALNEATPSTTDNVSLTTDETNIEPAYTKLMAVMSSATLKAPKGIIAIWKGTLATIPGGWILCDGSGGTVDMRGRHLKITATVAHIGNTGGSNTHTHAAQNHTHTVAHTHTGTTDGHSQVHATKGSGVTGATSGTTHALTTNSVNLVLNNASTEAESSNNEPAFRTVAFIKLTKGPTSANFLLNFM